MARSKNVDDFNSLKDRFKEFGRKQKERRSADTFGLGGYGDDPPEDKVSKSEKRKAGSGMTRGQKRRDERALGAPVKPQTADDAMAALTDDKIGQDIATSGAAYRQEVAPVKAAAAAAKAPGTQEAKMLADLGSSDLSYNPSVKDPQVEVMQKALRAAGYSIQVDGRFGPNTQAAVKDFQRKMQVPVTGVADAATRESLAQTAGGDVGMMGADFVKPGAGRRGTGAAAPAVAAAPEPAAEPAGSDPAPAPPDLRESPVSPDEAPAFAGNRKPGEMGKGPMQESFGLPPATEMKVGVPPEDVEVAGMGGRILEEASDPLTALKRPRAAARRVLTPTREAEIQEMKADLRGEMTPVAAAMYSFYRSGQADDSVRGIVQGLSANQKDLTEADVDTFLDRMVSDRLISSAKRTEILKQLMRNEAVEADTGTAGMATL